MSLTAPEQPVPGQDPQSTPDPTQAGAAPAPTPSASPTPTAPPATAAGSAPWAADLNAVFTDEATRGQVDQFLRENVQPYTTQLEQRASSNADAQRLYDAFSNEPVDAYVAITEELFGPDAAQQLLGVIQQQLESGQSPAPPQEGAPQFQQDDRTAQLLQWVEDQQNNTAYDEAMATIANDPEYADVDPDLLHPFVAAAGGDFGEAVNVYRAQAALWQQKFGQPPAEQPPAEQPPATLGSDTATVQASSTPVEPRKQSLGDAIEEFVRESRPSAAPPIGSV